MRMRERVYRPVKPWISALTALLLIGVIGGCFAAAYACFLIDAVLDGRRDTHRHAHISTFALREQMVQEQVNTRVRGWLSLVQREDVLLETKRGTLRGSLFFPVRPDRKAMWALVLHGGMGTERTQVLDVACELSLLGYHVLTPDLYAHGESDGKISSLGIADAQDVRLWCEWIKDREPEARVVIFGQDEGAAAALLAAAETLPDYVKAVAADSAYRSVRERMLSLLEDRGYHAGVLNRAMLNLAYRLTHGTGLEAGEIAAALDGCRLPLLLIHGTGDHEVPAWHSQDLAAAGERAMLLFVEGAAHGMARYADKQAVDEALYGFFEAALSK